MGITLSTAAVAGLETLVKAALRYDPATRRKLGKLAGRVLAVEMTAPALRLYITADEAQLYLMSHWGGEVHTRLKGSLSSLLSLARSGGGNLAQSGVEMMGDTGLLLDLQSLLRDLDIDWEEALSQLFGDLLGHQSAQLIRGGLNYGRDRASEAQRLLSEFLTEELQSLPSKLELEDFNQQVDDLRLRLDRLEARMTGYFNRTSKL